MKSGTFTQIHIQIVFAVKNRECLLKKIQREELFKYINGILERKRCKSVIVNGFSDHIHVFIGLNPTVSISDLVHDIKISTSTFINNEKRWFKHKFAWQEGYGAFSYSHSHVPNVYKYILNQERHHQMKPFRKEYIEFLEKFDVKFNERYLFEFFD